MDPELEALEHRVARIRLRSHEHDHGFAASVLETASWLLLRWDSFAETSAGRSRKLSPQERTRACDAILQACPAFDRLADLGCQLQTRELEDILREHAVLTASELTEDALPAFLTRMDATLGRWQGTIIVATTLGRGNRKAAALSLLAEIDSAKLAPLLQLLLADALASAGAPERAEALYTSLLGRRWLSGRMRRRVVEGYAEFLEESGRRAEARRLELQQRVHPHSEWSGGAGPMVRSGPKVARNDPCPCGSGKKAKKCCGVAA
jgi:hypothetical protein